MFLERFERLLLSVRHTVEIIALIVAGYWTYHIFNVKDMPSLEQSVQVSLSIELSPFNSNKILETNSLKITNIGKSSFNISSINRYIWIYPVDSFLTGSTFDIEDFLDRELIVADISTSLGNSLKKRFHTITTNSIRANRYMSNYYFPGNSCESKSSDIICNCRQYVVLVACVVYAYQNDKPMEQGPIIRYVWNIIPSSKVTS